MTTSTQRFYEENAVDLSKRYETAEVSEMYSQMLAVFDKSNPRLLELGCGSGRDAAFMLKNGFDVVAVDGSSEMIDAAQKCHPELVGRLSVADLPSDLEQIEEKYNGIYSIATLMHLSENQLQSVIKKVSTLLLEEGCLFFSVCIKRSDLDANGYDSKGRYFNIMAKNEWLALCCESGLEIFQTFESGDGLGRDDIVWLTVAAKKV